MGKRIRFRNAENIIGEIEMLIRDYKIKEISFYDDTFTANRNNVLKLCSLIKEKKLDITWSCMSRVDMIDVVLLKEMRSAGCHQIGYGIESADQEVLGNIKKQISFEKVKEAARLTRKAGIDFRGMFMFGNPGETSLTMKKTLQFAIDLNCDLAVFNITTPYPGTEMFDWADKNGYLLTYDWRKYDLSKQVMRLPTVGNEEVEYFYRYAYKKFYLRPGYILKKIFRLRNLLDLQSSAGFFWSLLKGWLKNE
jgi:radical SAM superfamily enzyme YgiQ (UPF0313 family)